MILEHSPALNAFSAANTANMVLPVPAGPDANTIRRCSFSNRSTYFSWFSDLGTNCIRFFLFWYDLKSVLFGTTSSCTALRRCFLNLSSLLLEMYGLMGYGVRPIKIFKVKFISFNTTT